MAAQDKLAPTIEILSPGENEVYYSQVDFSLRVLDDAESAEDGQGDLASISFDLANDDLRGGRTVIDTNGTPSQDSSFGPDEILYDPESGLVSFSFSTVSPNTVTGIISVTVSAEDRNGNHTEQTLTLADNEGPWLSFSVVDTVSGQERSYTEDTTVRLSGTLGNSIDDPGSADEVTSITWSVLGKSWNGELVIDPDATYVDPDSGDTLNYYNTSENRYERLNEGVAYPELFLYYPETRSFRTDIEIPFGAGSVLPFEVTVTDKNGHETTMTVNAFSDESGPEVIIEFPKDENAFYTLTGGVGGNINKSDVIEGYINGGIADLQSFKFQIKDSTGEFYTDKLDVSPGTTDYFDAFDTGSSYNDDSNEFYIDISDYLSLMQNDSGDSYIDEVAIDEDIAKDVSVTIYAVNDDDFETRPKLIVYKDLEGPLVPVSGITFSSIGSDDPAYAKSDSNLEMSFTVTDDSTDASDLTVVSQTLGGDPAALDSQGTTYSFSSSYLDWPSGMSSDDNITYSIVLEDRLGNRTTLNQDTADAPQVMYYAGAPVYGTHLSFTADGPDSHEGFIAQDEQLDIIVTSTRDLQTPELSDIAVNTTTMSTLAADSISPDSGSPMNIFTAVYFPGAEGVDEEELKLVMTLTDKAGNTLPAPTDIATAYYYDSVAPSAPSMPTLDSADDTYLAAANLGSNSDGITKNFENLQIVGTAEAESSVYVYIDGSSTASFNDTAEGGSWSGYLPGPLDHGTHPIIARTIDRAGNESGDSGTFNLQVLRNLPSDPISIDLREDSDSSRPNYAAGLEDNITNIEAVDIDGTASVGSYMVLYVDGSAQAYTTANGLGNWTKSINLASGDKTYSLEVKTADIAGNESSGSEILDIILDNVNNTSSTIILSAEDDTGFQSNDGFTKLHSGLTFTGEISYGAGDDNDVNSNYGVVLSGNTLVDIYTYPITNVRSDVSSDIWSADIVLDANDGTPLAGEYQGEYTITVITEDAAGNSSGSTANTDIVFDNTAPTGSSLSGLDLVVGSDTGIEDFDNVTKDDIPDFYIDSVISSSLDKNTFSTSVSDLLYLDLMTEDVDTHDIQTIGTTSFSGDYTGDSTVSTIIDSDGEYYVTVSICDRAGNVSVPVTGSGSDDLESLNKILTIDTTPPDTAYVYDLELKQNETYDTGYYQNDGKTNNPGTLVFDFTLSSYDSSEEYYLELFSNEDGLRGQELASLDGSGNGSITSTSGFSTTGSGHDITVDLYDRAGNISDVNTNNAADQIWVNTDRPSADLSLTLSNDTGFLSTDLKTNVAGQTLTFSFDALGEAGYIRYSWDSIYSNSAELATDATSTTLAKTLTGSNGVTAVLYDIYGNDSTGNSISDTIYFDNAGPSGGSITSFYLSDDTGFETDDLCTNVPGQTLSFNFTGISEESYLKLDFTPQGGALTTLKSSTTFSSDGSDSLDITLAEGTNNAITAGLYDVYGNEYSGSSITDTIWYDITKPDANADLSSLSLNSSSDTGQSDSDDETKSTDADLSFDINVDDTSLTNFYITLEAEKQSDSSTTSTDYFFESISQTAQVINFTNPGEGVYDMTATLYDQAGNISLGDTALKQ